MPVQFLLGGARSGKSSLAEKIAIDSTLKVTYIATAAALDNEISDRIKKHQKDRPSYWDTIEEEVCLAKVLNQLDDVKNCIIVDCLTLWMLNLLTLDNEVEKELEINLFLTSLSTSKALIILVSNEVGNGVIPMGELSRQFVDESGFLHQKVAKAANRVEFIMAGLPITLKG